MAFDIQRLRSERVYQNSAPAQVLLEDVEKLRSLDAELEVKRQWWSRCGRYVGIAGAVAFFTMFIPFVGVVGFGLCVLLLVAMFVCHRMASRYRMLDLENRRYELVALTLQTLRKDIAPDEPVTLEMDFHPTNDKRHLTDKGEVGQWKTESFVQRWLSLQVRLMDGTQLRLGMEERLQERKRTRRNPRGKLKVKRKEKGFSLIQVQLRVKPERHPQLARLGPEARKAVRLPKGVSLARLEVVDGRLSLRARLDRGWKAQKGSDLGALDAPRTVILSLLSLYQVLNYSTALRKREAARLSA